MNEIVLRSLGRQQFVKIGIVKSDWCKIRNWAPQGSIPGPLLFNIFINDLFYFLEHLCTLYNYADDNSISLGHQDIAQLKLCVEMLADVAVEWFWHNNMQANSSKLRGIVIARGNDVATPVTFNIRYIDIPANENVKVLGIQIDDKLKFYKHISELCKRTLGHLNAISWISLYHSFILSHFHYCNIVWHNCDTENTIKIEKIQKRGLGLSWMIINLAVMNF